MEANGFPVHCVCRVVRLFARRVVGRPQSNETAETTHVSGGEGSCRGGEQDTTPAGSRNHLKIRPNMTRAIIWPASAQDLRFRAYTTDLYDTHTHTHAPPMCMTYTSHMSLVTAFL